MFLIDFPSPVTDIAKGTQKNERSQNSRKEKQCQATAFRIYLTLFFDSYFTFFSFQMRCAYSSMERSAAKCPAAAMFKRDFLFHNSLF